MCDYCGCRRQAAIDELSDEHDRLLNLTYGLRRAARQGDHATVIETLDARIVPLLRRHTDKEERGLFTQLRNAWAVDERLDRLVDEHRDIEVQIARVRAGGPTWVHQVRQLADTLSAHIMDEETDLFPYALYELDAAQWTAVEAVHGESDEPRHDLEAATGA